jgi:hypothetical protein
MSPGLRLLLLVSAPLLGSLLTHELRRRPRMAMVVAAAAIAASGVLALTLIPAVTGGGSAERGLGSAIAGVDLTLRADSASVAVVLVSCLAALLALPRHRASATSLSGLVLCVAGTATVATGGNLVLVAAGIEAIAGGALLLRGRRGPGRRTAAALAGLHAGAGLAVLSAAAQLVAAAGSSDLASVPPGAVGGAIGVPWALAAIALLVSPVVLGNPASPAREWGAVAALPAGFLVLLRLQQSTGGQLSGAAAVTLAVAGGVVGVAAVVSARGAPDVRAVGRSVTGVTVGVLLSLAAGPLVDSGTVVAGLFLAAELALLAAPVWERRPSAWSVASIAVLALPGGAALAVASVGAGAVAARGDVAFPQLLVLVATMAAAAVISARVLVTAPRGWSRVGIGPVVALTCAVAGSLVPGLALRQVAAPFAGGASAVDVDALALRAPGAGFAAGYLTLAVVLMVVAGAAALAISADGPLAAPAPVAAPRRLPVLTPVLQVRRVAAPRLTSVRARLDRADHWLESQPHLPVVVAAAAVAVLLFR